MSTSSADPDALLAFASEQLHQAESCTAMWTRLQHDTDSFNALCVPNMAMGGNVVVGLADDLHAIARRLFTLAHDTGTVGAAFARVNGPYRRGTARTIADVELQRLLQHADGSKQLADDLVAMSISERQTMWQTMSPAVALSLITHHARTIGGLDGVPWAVRVKANHRLVMRALADAENGDDPALAALLRGLAKAQVLLFAPRAGRVAVLHGNLDTARNIAIFVPGMGSTFNGFLTGASGTDNKGAAIFRACAPDDDNQSAVISWLGYPAPSAIPGGAVEVPRTTAAQQGARQLESFVAGLDRTATQRLTLVGHSYGTLVVGLALKDGLHVDDVVLAGSPGVGVDRADDLRKNISGDVYVLAAPGDPVAQLAWFGADPDAPSFGATRLTTNAPGLPHVSAHSRYFVDGTASLANIAAVVSGRKPTSQKTTTADRARDTLTRAARYTTPGVAGVAFLAEHYDGPGDEIVDVADKFARQTEQTPARIFDAGRFVVDKLP